MSLRAPLVAWIFGPSAVGKATLMGQVGHRSPHPLQGLLGIGKGDPVLAYFAAAFRWDRSRAERLRNVVRSNGDVHLLLHGQTIDLQTGLLSELHDLIQPPRRHLAVLCHVGPRIWRDRTRARGGRALPYREFQKAFEGQRRKLVGPWELLLVDISAGAELLPQG